MFQNFFFYLFFDLDTPQSIKEHFQRVIEQLALLVQECYLDAQKVVVKKRKPKKKDQPIDPENVDNEEEESVETTDTSV